MRSFVYCLNSLSCLGAAVSEYSNAACRDTKTFTNILSVFIFKCYNIDKEVTVAKNYAAQSILHLSLLCESISDRKNSDSSSQPALQNYQHGYDVIGSNILFVAVVYSSRWSQTLSLHCSPFLLWWKKPLLKCISTGELEWENRCRHHVIHSHI